VTEMKAFIELAAKSLVAHPDEVVITEAEGEDGTTRVLELRCAKDDLGQIIGRGGRTIKALRTLLVTAAARTGVRAVLEVANGEGVIPDDEDVEDDEGEDEESERAEQDMGDAR
jgi:predicted RNA-binding protein YlqC (UPF0109 family)